MSCLVQSKSRGLRCNVVHWWGNCSYRKLKVTIEYREMVCPLCKRDLEWADYYGSKEFAKSRDSIDYVRDGWLPLKEDGVVVWVIREHPPKYFG